MKILDGKKCSEEILENIKDQVSLIKERDNKVPGLAVIIVGENPASQVYVNSKVRTCEKVGIYSTKISLPEDISEEDLLKEIEILNSDARINGILVQLPLPKHLNEDIICAAIKTSKDVDGFKPENLGKVMLGEEDGFVPCTPQGVMYLLDTIENLDLYGLNAAIIGRSNIVGKPLANLLINRGVTVTVCNSRTKNIEDVLRNSDIIIAALGKPKFVTKDMVKKDCIIIDVGINRVDKKLCGDVDFDEVAPLTSYITPVPGGVGPMTIAMLLKNTLDAYNKEER